MRVSVIGAGSWGTAVARHLGKTNDVRLWAHSEEVASGINDTGRNPRYLVDCDLGARVSASCDMGEVLQDAQAAVFVVPSNRLREVAGAASAHIALGLPVIVLTKGIEPGTNYLMTEVVADVCGNPRRVACLSGPNHAEEVSRDLPSAAVVAAENPEVAEFFKDLFHAECFRTYVSSDMVGVEICSAAKNVVAVACGIARGFGTGDNTAALIMTRGLAEMSRLVAARGGRAITCMGLAGMGDLIATCTSAHSRNSTFGAAFARGETLEQFQQRTHMVVEGALACRSVRELAQANDVEVPIADAVFSMLYENACVEDVTSTLLSRVPYQEFYGI